jgi:hypothetical protein
MERVAIELVDSGLAAVSSRGRVSTPSPGLAIVDGETLLVGLEAASQARIKPRWLHSRFWQELSLEGLPRPFPSHLRTADLAHAHLSSVWQEHRQRADEVFLAVPGVYSRQQLGLAMGIARACDLPVRGLVDVAVAAAADRPVRPLTLHLDVHLHRAVLTVIRVDDQLARDTVHEEQRVGLVRLYDSWARTIAKRFVRDTRFDPLLDAATEQVLYVQLHGHLRELSSEPTTSVAISSGGRRYAIELDRDDMVGAASTAYAVLKELADGLAGDTEATLLLSDRAAGLPGLAQVFEAEEHLDVVALHPAAAGGAALAHEREIGASGPEMPCVTRLPRFDAREPGAQTVGVAEMSRPDTPTHVVIGGVAHRLKDDPLALTHVVDHDTPATVRILHGRAIIEGAGGEGVTINGKPVDGAAQLLVGDQLNIGSTTILLVKMAS